MFIQTEYEFALPRGYVDGEGNVHRKGIMRLATAIDEIETMANPKVRANPDYATVVLLSKVISRLEGVETISTEIIEKLFTGDFTFLQNMYETINKIEEPKIQVQCPHCGKTFTDTINFITGE